MIFRFNGGGVTTVRDRAVTINDVARIANVSNATVSRYLNKSSAVDQNKCRSIDEAIRTLGFRLNRNARVLKMNRSTQIMMIVPDIENPFYSVAYKVVQDIALQKGYTVTLYNSNGIEGNELNAIEIAHGLKIDGLIFCSINDYPQVFKALKDFGKPVVASNSFGELNFDTVHSIKGQGLYVTTNYLLSLGHTKIAYAGGDENSVLNERRFTGYQKALSEAGINLRPEYVFNFDFSMEGGYRAAKYFIGLSELPAAIACANDLIAMGVIQTLIGNGNRVPEDVSVTGMDNIEFSKLCMPPITTVTNNSREFAENCMELLLTRISQEYEGAPREYLTSRKLVVRESTR